MKKQNPGESLIGLLTTLFPTVQLKHRGISLSFIFSLLTESPKTIYIKMILTYPKKSVDYKKIKKVTNFCSNFGKKSSNA